MAKNLPAMRRSGFDPWVGKIPVGRESLPTPVFLCEEFHGQRSLAGYSPWGCRVRHDRMTNTYLLTEQSSHISQMQQPRTTINTTVVGIFKTDIKRMNDIRENDEK